MDDDIAPAASAAAPAEDLPRRKPWQAPVIEDVSVAMTAKNANTYETGSTKNGS